MTPMRRPVGTFVAVVFLGLLTGCVGSPAQRATEDANRLLAAGNVEEALAAYREGQRHSPDFADLHYGEGLVLYRMKRYADAEPALRRAIELEPGEAPYHVYLGHVVARLDRMEEAVAAYREATRLAPIDPAGWKGLGLAQYNLRRYPEARQALEKYVAFAPGADDAPQIRALAHSLPSSPSG